MTALAILIFAQAARARECVAVEGAWIRGEHAARADARLARLGPTETVALAPNPGATRVLREKEFNPVLRRAGLEPLNSTLSACFVYEMIPLDKARAADALRASIKGNNVEFEILETSRFPVPRGTIEFPRLTAAALQPDRKDGARLIYGAVRYGDRKRFPFWVRLRATEERWRFIANEPLPAGRPIAAGQVRKVKERVAVALDDGQEDPGQIEGLIPRRVVAAGAKLPLRLLERPKEIRRGDRVIVEVAEGQARLSLECKAESGGRQGERILLLNEASGKRFSAEVAGAGKAVLRGAAFPGNKK